jgi:hypothetical protein
LPDGIYVPNSGNAIGGGIYVHGDADQIVAVADTIANHQMLRITQSGVVTVVTIDTARNATEVTTATRTSTYQGIPRGIVYVTGAVRDLRGPGRVGSWIPAALLDGQWSFVAEGDIVVCGDLMDRGFPEVVPDTGCAASAIAGLWSVHGSVRIGADAPNDLHLDAFILAGGASGTFTVDDYAVGPPRGTLYVRGGVAEQYVGTFGVVDAAGHVLCGYAPSLRYDRRQLFPPWGLFPPYWPTVALPPLVESPVVRPPTATLHLAAPYPNPARSTVHVRFTLPTAGHARLTVFDIQGRRVAMPLDANQTAGEHVLDWSRGRSRGPLAPGIYFIRLEAGGASRSARVVLLN